MKIKLLRLAIWAVGFVSFAFSSVGYAAYNAASETDSLVLGTGFGNDMVLQRHKPIAVYGTAAAGATVAVRFLGQEQVTQAGSSGAWKVRFPATEHGGPYQMMVESPSRKIVLENILIGDVWLCSGQSNMDFQLNSAQTGPEELSKGVGIPNIRLFRRDNLAQTGNFAWDTATLAKVNRNAFFGGQWKLCNEESAKIFSAVGYYFGKAIAESVNVPIGLIQVSVGGSPTESWLDQETIERDTLLARMAKAWATSREVMPWCIERALVNTRHAKTGDQRHPYQPGYNFEAGLASLTSMPIKGVIWYQGESNAHHVQMHEYLFKALVAGWRKKWGYAFPFYYVQLSGIDRPLWPEFRDSQRRLLSEIPRSGMAVSFDLGDSLDVHPTRKKEVGERLAVLALNDSYGKAIVSQGPVVNGAVQKGNTIVVSFSSSSRLLAAGDGVLRGFEVVTTAGSRLAAPAVLVKNRVHITIPDGEKISTVLYAYQPFSRANLVNEAGLPASTFSFKIKK
jgi:sialate O-acetylesterase